jgi:outer membrane protein OmpA-like peptidoglycan-associated protein
MRRHYATKVAVRIGGSVVSIRRAFRQNVAVWNMFNGRFAANPPIPPRIGGMRKKAGLLASLGIAGAAMGASIATGIAAGIAAAPAWAAAPSAHEQALKRELDSAETLLRRRLKPLPVGNQIVMIREDDRLTLRIPARELFDPDNAHLRDPGPQALPWAAVSDLLRRRYRLAAQVNVYTDSIGGQEANRGFTQQRALALLASLHAASVRPARVAGGGEGSSAELAGDDTPEGRDQNRRVEVVFGLPEPGFP